MSRRGSLLARALSAHLTTGRPLVLPAGGKILWSAFAALSAERTMSMTGPNPITFAEIESWARLNRYPLLPHHVSIIRAMDDAWLTHAYTTGKSADGPSLPQSPGQPLTAAAFDAVFA